MYRIYIIFGPVPVYSAIFTGDIILAVQQMLMSPFKFFLENSATESMNLNATTSLYGSEDGISFETSGSICLDY